VAVRGGATPAALSAAAEDAVRSLLVALGQDPEAEHLKQTPRRVAAAYSELLTPDDFELTTFANEERYDQLVLARDIPFRSLCEHHMLPFYGVAHVGYLPAQRIAGLSKLARVVEGFARGLQVQERLTKQIADCLDSHLQPKGVGGSAGGRAPVHVTARGARARVAHPDVGTQRPPASQCRGQAGILFADAGR
jgi:GTP cyclohydrolase IA